MHRNASDSLSGGTPWRLRDKRAHAAKYPDHYKSWREVSHVGRIRGGLPKEGAAHGNAPFKIGFTDVKWMEDVTDYFPQAHWCDEIVTGIRHTGWYTDSFQSSGQTARGVVLTLPGRRGFLAAIADPYNFDRKTMDGPCIVEFNYVYADEDDAARGADGLAETYAEDAREDDAKQLAERDIEDARDEIAGIRTRLRELVAGIRESKLAPVVCETLRNDVRRLLAEKTKAFRLIAKREADFWSAVPN